jgi:hypothetical protein
MTNNSNSKETVTRLTQKEEDLMFDEITKNEKRFD